MLKSHRADLGWFSGLAFVAFAACAACAACASPASRVTPELPIERPLASGTEHVRLLGFNDFHGNLLTTRKVDDRPVGGAAVFAAYVKRSANDVQGKALLIHAGDQVGASPPISALLQDEPSVQFLNLLGNASCSVEDRGATNCNLVGTLGNHEFDEGRVELMRLIHGGDSPLGPFLEKPYRGAAFEYVCANVVDAHTGTPLFPPYVIKQVGSVRVGVIGAVVRQTPTIVTPTGVASLSFLDEADAINAAVDALLNEGVRAIVVTIHQGGAQTPYLGPTDRGTTIEGEILPIIGRLSDEVDVVISGHAHQFSNAFVRNQTGKSLLVTQALSAGTAFAEIDLKVDLVTGDVVHKTAQIVTTFADVSPGTEPDPSVLALVDQVERLVGPRINRVVGHVSERVARAPNESGESALGNLVADAQRAAAGTDLCLTNMGGMRADMEAGEVTWGELFTIQPFGNSLVRMELMGSQLVELLERQWLNPDAVRMLQISGFTYSWDSTKPVGLKVSDVRVNGELLDKQRVYSLVVNSFMADGGDLFQGGALGVNHATRGADLDALVDFVQARRDGIRARIDGRIVRVR